MTNKTRWERMVEKASFCMEEDGEGLNPVLFADVAVDILARQRAAMVRMVKRADTYKVGLISGMLPSVCMIPSEEGEWINVKDLLAALATQGRKKK